jgi:hypothetical protein
MAWTASMPLHIRVGKVAANQEGVMAYSSSRLPSRFPVGTKFVIESHRGRAGQVYSQFLEFPDGTFLPLPNSKPAHLPRNLASKSASKARLRRSVSSRQHQAAGH